VGIKDVESLDERLSRPTPEVTEALSRAEGDIIILGAGGKMGPSLSRMVRRAVEQAGSKRRVIAVSRFQDSGPRAQLESWGIETFPGDLLDPALPGRLPDCPNVVYMVGRKFGSSEDSAATWASNAYLPGVVAARFASSRILAFSTGNVYPFTSAGGAGPREDHPLSPVGEYGQSCVGRERVLEHFSHRNGTRVAIIRLNYAIDLRYGVLVDVARKVLSGEPIDLAMGSANVIWQGDANAWSLRALPLAASPPFVLNVAGPQVSIRSLAIRFGEAFGRKPVFQGAEAMTALLSDGSRARELFGPPATSLDTMVAWAADWLRRGGEVWDRPTHFEVRDGKF
jgi:nucleoside-diphosphate-sugar epimerase